MHQRTHHDRDPLATYVSDAPPSDFDHGVAFREAVTLLMGHAGFSIGDAALWASGWGCREDAIVAAQQAIQFDAQGLTLHDGLDWHHRGFYAREATAWHRRGYTPEEAQAVYVHEPREAHRWLHNGVTPARTMLYVAAGVCHTEVAAMEARRAHGDDVDAALHTLAALRPPRPIGSATSEPAS